MIDGFIGFAMGVIVGVIVTFFVMCVLIGAYIAGGGNDDEI
jgi:hypothetical protein